MNKKQLIVAWVMGIALFLAGFGYFATPYLYEQLNVVDLYTQRLVYVIILLIYLIILIPRAQTQKFVIWTLQYKRFTFHQNGGPFLLCFRILKLPLWCKKRRYKDLGLNSKVSNSPFLASF